MLAEARRQGRMYGWDQALASFTGKQGDFQQMSLRRICTARGVILMERATALTLPLKWSSYWLSRWTMR